MDLYMAICVLRSVGLTTTEFQAGSAHVQQPPCAAMKQVIGQRTLALQASACLRLAFFVASVQEFATLVRGYLLLF
jgi:hypothetical protein